MLNQLFKQYGGAPSPLRSPSNESCNALGLSVSVFLTVEVEDRR